MKSSAFVSGLLWVACATGSLAQPVQVLDNFDSGDIVVDTTVRQTFGDPVPGVFGDNRAILLLKEDEQSATSVSVGSGVFTWNQTGADYAAMLLGTATTNLDLSAYDALRLSVISAPQGANEINFWLWYFGDATHLYGLRGTVALPTSGVLEVPFASFVGGAGFPPLDLTQVHAVGFDFSGDTGHIAPGTYVFDNFLAVVAVPEPSSPALFGVGMLALLLLRARAGGRLRGASD